MASVNTSKNVASSPSEVWERIGDFHGLHTWVAGMQPTEAVDDGRARKVDLGATPLVEELVEQGDHSYTYRIVEGPLPVKEYTATLRVSGDGDGSLVEWSATFEPNGVPEDQAVAIVTGIFNSGLAGL